MNKGYVNAEAVIGVRNPVYDEDNLRVEALRMTGDLRQIQAVDAILFGRRDIRDAGNYERASRRMVEQGLTRLR